MNVRFGELDCRHERLEWAQSRMAKFGRKPPVRFAQLRRSNGPSAGSGACSGLAPRTGNWVAGPLMDPAVLIEVQLQPMGVAVFEIELYPLR